MFRNTTCKDFEIQRTALSYEDSEIQLIFLLVPEILKSHDRVLYTSPQGLLTHTSRLSSGDGV